MEVYISVDKDEKLSSFSYAEGFYNACKSGFIDAETVAKMMLLEVERERKSIKGE